MATHTLLHEGMLVMGVNPHQLARLLGLKNAHAVYGWLNGTWSPSRGFSIRLNKLLIMVVAGVKLAEAAWIDWTTGEVHWKKGFGPAAVTQPVVVDANPPSVKAGSYRTRELNG